MNTYLALSQHLQEQGFLNTANHFDRTIWVSHTPTLATLIYYHQGEAENSPYLQVVLMLAHLNPDKETCFNSITGWAEHHLANCHLDLADPSSINQLEGILQQHKNLCPSEILQLTQSQSSPKN